MACADTNAERAGGRPPSGAGVRVVAHARLHLGFLDLNGGLGRRFGSVGVALAEPLTEVVAWPAAEARAEGPSAARALDFARRMCRHLGVHEGVHIQVRRAIPEHAGLGSGTQLALAIGTAVARLHGERPGAAEVAAVLERGQRSGVGIGVFERGGLVVDAGRAAPGAAPVVVAHAPVPPGWRVILVTDDAMRGLNGPRERAAFTRLPPMHAAQAAAICRRVLMQVLPAVIEGDLETFGAGIDAIQRAVGAYFAPQQGGAPFTSAAVERAIAWLKAEGAAATGQTSWGPTGFAVVADRDQAERLVRRARERFQGQDSLGFAVRAFANDGASVDAIRAGSDAHPAALPRRSGR